MNESKSNHDTAQDEHVTALFDRTVRPGKEEEYKRWYRELINLSEASPGHISTHVIQQGRRFLTLQQFDGKESLHAWLDSGVRRAQMGKLAELTEAAPDPQELSGLEPWFELPGQTALHVPKWKMALVTFFVIYTLVSILSYLVLPYIVDWPILVRSLAFPAVMVPLMTYVIMPRLTKLLKKWLYK